MKKNILITIVACILMFTQNSFAQDIWVAAISSSGILLGNYKIAESSINPIPTTITLEEAKNIFTLNILETGKGRKINRVKVKSYQMTIMNKDESTSSITNNTEILSEEMKARLQNLEVGTKLFLKVLLRPIQMMKHAVPYSSPSL
ncbi:MAG: hypothetical protein IPH33_13350 [Bacteroidetes bacterium]|nr:hypothetical protein [Bacteroidota bacterium]